MPRRRSEVTTALQAFRRDARALATPIKGDPSLYNRGYRAALRDIDALITRHIRRSGDGRASS